MLTNKEIVWTPKLGPNSLAIALAHHFAKACMAHQEADMERFVGGVWRLMGNELPVKPSNFLDIHEGILPKGIYSGHGGMWLTTNMLPLTSADEDEALIYYGHNEDHVSDRLWLMQAFGAWADAAHIVMNRT